MIYSDDILSRNRWWCSTSDFDIREETDKFTGSYTQQVQVHVQHTVHSR